MIKGDLSRASNVIYDNITAGTGMNYHRSAFVITLIILLHAIIRDIAMAHTCMSQQVR